MLKILNKKNILIFLILIFLVCFLIKYTLADNDSIQSIKVTENSELIYYLNVKYDGIDVSGIDSESIDTSSSNIITSKLDSGYIFVEDKLPEGLQFDDFVLPNFGSGIGANFYYEIEEGTNFDQYCHGNILDDTNESNTNSGTWNSTNTEYYFHGLHYNKQTNTVSFIVENLQAGCNLSVGIKTTVPSLADYPLTSRIDFYNYAIIRETIDPVFSNIVNNYIGNDSETLYNVKYKFSGISDSISPVLPPTTQYAENNIVGTFSPGYIKGYKFTGWQSGDVTISDNKFKMPNHDVEITGTFVESGPFSVTYVIDGIKPESYELPNTMQYYPFETVSVNSLKKGDIIDGYKFLGWETTDANIIKESFSDIENIDEDSLYGNYNRFIMPEHNVTFTGKFEKVKYKLTYKFNDSVLPPNSSNLLPESQLYDPGEDVQLANISNVSGYKFLGWNKDSSFKMPDEDVIVYGSWKVFRGYFEPKLNVSITNVKEYYNPNDVIDFVIDVYNDSPISIKKASILISDNLSFAFDGITFNNVQSDEFDEILPNEHYYIDYSLDLSSLHERYYKSLYGDFIFDTYTDDEILYPSSVDINFSLYNAFEEIKNGEYEFKSTGDIENFSIKIQPYINVCQEIDGENVGNIFQYKLTSSSGYEAGFFLESDKCLKLYLNPGTYNLLQITPQEYNLKSVTGKINSNNSNFNIQYEDDDTITFVNEFVKKKFMHSFGRIINTVERKTSSSSGGGGLAGG